MPKKKKLYVKVYFSSPEEMQAVADRAAGAGFRRGGLPVLIKKPHGWDWEKEANTDGISTYLKDCEEKVASANELALILKKLVNKR